MTTATVEVPHRDIPKFQYWLAHSTEEVTHGLSRRVERAGAELALDDLRTAEAKLKSIRALMEQGQKAVAGEKTTYTGEAEILLDICHGMLGEYAYDVAIHEDPGPWDFSKAENSIDGLAYWVRMGNRVQTAMLGEAVA